MVKVVSGMVNVEASGYENIGFVLVSFYSDLALCHHRNGLGQISG